MFFYLFFRCTPCPSTKPAYHLIHNIMSNSPFRIHGIGDAQKLQIRKLSGFVFPQLLCSELAVIQKIVYQSRPIIPPNRRYQAPQNWRNTRKIGNIHLIHNQFRAVCQYSHHRINQPPSIRFFGVKFEVCYQNFVHLRLRFPPKSQIQKDFLPIQIESKHR